MENTFTFTFTHAELETIRRFHGWCMYAPEAYCAVCLQVLYPEQVKFHANNARFPCEDWGRKPMTSWPENWEKLDAVYSYRFTAFEVIGVIVCKNCSNLDAPFEKKALKYPGE